MNKFLSDLCTAAWRTAGARYNAARRLKKRELVSTVSLAFLSALTVAIAFTQRVYSVPSGSELDNYLTSISACLGIFLLAISLMEWGAANGAKADALHKNAEELNSYRRHVEQTKAELNSGIAITWDQVTVLRTEYEAIKLRCSYNHDPIDDRLFLAEQRNATEFLNGTKPIVNGVNAIFIRFQHYFSSIWYFFMFWLIVLLLSYFTPWGSDKSVAAKVQIECSTVEK